MNSGILVYIDVLFAINLRLKVESSFYRVGSNCSLC
jgi:hypothetical protein